MVDVGKTEFEFYEQHVYTYIYTFCKEVHMRAKVFENGGSQAIRLPKECRFDGKEVEVRKIFGTVFVSPKEDNWVSNLQGLDLLTDELADAVLENRV